MESGAIDVTASEVVKGLAGELAPNRALDALTRLCSIGALEELPHLGRPHARMFRKLTSAYWEFVQEVALVEGEPSKARP
jgi:predicted urease superfamily metal-dependent hydrolase